MRDESRAGPSKLRRGVRYLGLILTVASIAYLLWAIAQSDLSEWALFRSWTGIAKIAALGVGYAVSLFLLFVAWLLLLGQRKGTQLNLKSALDIYALFQILKYLPTNVLHQVGRFAMLHDKGLSTGRIAVSSLAEAILVAAAALLVGLLAGGQYVYVLVANRLSDLILPIFVVGILGLAAVTFLVIKFKTRRHAFVEIARREWSIFAFAFFIYVVFFVISGLIFVLLARLNSPEFEVSIALIIAAGSASWVAGFLTPGAPGGIGVREVTILALLAPYGSTDTVLALAGQLRIITILGDFFFFCGMKGFAMTRRNQSEV